MSILSPKESDKLFEDYFRNFGISLSEVSANGEIHGELDFADLRNHPFICRIRADAMQEAMRWGEAGTFFVAPGIISWILPVLDGDVLRGGLLGGEVLPKGVELDRTATIYHLRQTGCSTLQIDRYIKSLPTFPQERIKEASDLIRDALCRMSPSSAAALNKSRDDSMQQREIAQFIQEKKGARSSGYALDRERILLSLIRVGDKNAARGVLNDMLASSFLYSPKLLIIKSRMIEMMGHLVRSAIEDSPVLEKLLGYQQQWMNAIIEAVDFNDLCNVTRRSLDDFIDQIFLQRFNRTNTHVSVLLEYLSLNYMRSITLDEIAEHIELSKYRIAHLVKDMTGQSIFQHIKRMRVEKAQELLATTSQSYAEVTYVLGFTDQSAFIKQFRELTGTTPAKYRKHCLYGKNAY